jgi:mRNA interferase HigB
MHIRNELALIKFAVRHPAARKPMERWSRAVRNCSWKSLADVRELFSATDYVKGMYIFNIGGNNFRVLAHLDFTTQTATILRTLTHDEYSKLRL